ncbi:MAG: ferredoxin, partial [Sulfurimonas sp.]
ENFLSSYGEDIRGYILDEVTCKISDKVEPISKLRELEGTIIYHSNPVLQFNAYTNTTSQLERDTSLRGSKEFALEAKISDGDTVEISFASKIIQRKFKLDPELKGKIALNPTFDVAVDRGRYKYEKSNIVRI